VELCIHAPQQYLNRGMIKKLGISILKVTMIGLAATTARGSDDPFAGFFHTSVCRVPDTKRVNVSKEELRSGIPPTLQDAAEKYIRASSIGVHIQHRPDRVSYSGLITSRSVAFLAAHIGDSNKSPKPFYINSFGGESDAAIAMSELLRKKNFSVVVDGFCVSACANHILGPRLGQEQVSIRGVVWLHGSTVACLASRSLLGHLREIGIQQWWRLQRQAWRELKTPPPPLFQTALSLSQRQDRGGLDGRPRSFLHVGADLLTEMGGTVDKSSEKPLMAYRHWLEKRLHLGLLPVVTIESGADLRSRSARAAGSLSK
jgi:hypothetical protein